MIAAKTEAIPTHGGPGRVKLPARHARPPWRDRVPPITARAGKPQASSPALPRLEQAAGNVDLEAPPSPIVIADYGASQGRNSLVPVAAAIGRLRARVGSRRAISVVHPDLAGNDFAALFQLLTNDAASYLRRDSAAFSSAVGRSFYEQILPSGIVSRWKQIKGATSLVLLASWLRWLSPVHPGSLLRRVWPEAKTPAPSCHLYLFTAPNAGMERLGGAMAQPCAGHHSGLGASRLQPGPRCASGLHATGGRGRANVPHPSGPRNANGCPAGHPHNGAGRFRRLGIPVGARGHVCVTAGAD